MPVDDGPPEQSVEDEGLATPQTDQIGTPMEDRVAVLGLLNKRNGRTRDIELQPGQAMRIGNRLVVRLRACERTAPWETTPEQGAFVQLLVNQGQNGDSQNRWKRVFSGWLFKENPELNVVQHPVYDVWVKECRMSFPGEEDDAASDEVSSESSEPQSVSAPNGEDDAAPAPAEEPEAAPTEESAE